MINPEIHRERPRISVIIPHLNTPELLEKCLRSVGNQRLDHGTFEIIVVDNGSAKLPTAIVSPHANARLLIQPTAGPGPARNMGIAAAESALLACIDADCIAEPDWLQAAVDALESDPEHPIGGLVTIMPASPPKLTGIEAYESIFGFRQHMYIEKKHFSVTANLAMHTGLFEKIGPFGGIDIAEDVDWGQRAARLGHPTRYVRSMHVQHPARPDMAALQRKWRRHISHYWRQNRKSGHGNFIWYMKAIALLGSIPFHAISILWSQNISGIQNRLRGIKILASIRLFRCLEMFKTANNTAGEGHNSWNRQ